MSQGVAFVILPHGPRHSLPIPFFNFYCHVGVLRRSAQTPLLARVRKDLRAWPDPDSGGLRFETIKRTPIQEGAVTLGYWARILDCALLGADDNNMLWREYDSLAKTFGRPLVGKL